MNLCMCMCVYVYIYMYVCIYVCMYLEYSYVRPFKVIQFSNACNHKQLTLIKLLTKIMVIIRIFLDLDIKIKNIFRSRHQDKK